MVHGRGKEHDGRVDLVLNKCKEFNITLRPEKCFFGKEMVTWFGNVYFSKEMSPDPEKVVLIKKWPEPKEKSEVKSFLQTGVHQKGTRIVTSHVHCENFQLFLSSQKMCSLVNSLIN